MIRTESFKLPAEGAAIEGTICLPESASAESPVPCVLVCRNLSEHNPGIDRFWDAMIDALTERGIAVVTFEPRCAHLILDEFDGFCLEDYFADVRAVYQHLLNRDELRHDAIGVLGYRLGSLAAAYLAGDERAVHPLCLLAPMFGGGTQKESENGAARNGRSRPAPESLIPRAMAEQLPRIELLESLRDDERDILILLGAADSLVRPEDVNRFAEMMSQDNVPRRVELVVRADHTFNAPEARTACIDRIVRLFAALAAQSSKKR